MIAAMLVFTCVDAAVKVAGRFATTGQLLLVVSIGSLLIFFPLLKRNGEAFFSRNVFHRAMIVRSLGELFAWFGLTEALRAAGFQPVTTSVHLLQTLQNIYGPGLWQAPGVRPDFFDLLYGTDRVRLALQDGVPAPDIAAEWKEDRAHFRAEREGYLLY